MATPLIVVVGETASGKSQLAFEIAKAFNGEIICADAWTIRREASIGTAKPSLEERQAVPHHLLDIIGPDAPFNAAEFKKLANKAIEDIASRGHLPVMVGGSGLYIDSVIFDYQFLPKASADQRKELNSLTIDQLQTKASKKGIDLEGVDIKNKRRLIRLLETDGKSASKGDLRENTLLIGLTPNRDHLTERIADRLNSMIEQGLEQEVKKLREHYGSNAEALKGISYVEWGDYFDGRIGLEKVKQNIMRDTLDLAKKQRTWFRRNKSIHWFTTPINWSDVVDLLTTFLSA